MVKSKTILTKMICGLLIFMTFLTVCMPVNIKAATTERKTVRVGYYPTADYQEKKEDGSYTGFGYDYYIQIQKYTRWNYEFVEAGYADCMKMLATGEIDIMGGVTETPERAEIYNFSDYSNSNSQNKIYARADNEDLFYESYDTFDGRKIAMQAGMRTDEVEEYFKNHHFQAEIVTYNSYAEMEEALLSGEVDMLCASSISTEMDTKIVARLKKQPLYYATTKGKPEIVEELNDALQKITDNNPEFLTQMSQKYRMNGANATATFTREEMEYIQSGRQIYLIVNNNWNPFTWYDEETGEYCGILTDVVDEIADYSGLNITPCTADEFDEMVNENPDIMGDALAVTADDIGWAEKRSIMMTNHIVNTSIVMISQTGKHVDLENDDAVIALPSNFYISYALQDALKDKKILYYDTIQKCFDAVNSGEADVTFQDSIVSSYYLSMLKYANLYTSADSGYSESIAFGVYSGSDTPLLSILDKSLLCIGSEEINRIVVKYSYADEEFSLEGLYYSNPDLIITIVLVLCCMIILIVYFRVKAVNAIKQGKQEKMLARFMGYVCASNDEVMEVNLQTHLAQSYSLDENGEVKIQTFPYKNIHSENQDEAIHPEDFEKMMQNLSEEIVDEMIDSSGGQRYFECRAKGEDGNYQWYSFSMQAIPKDKEHPKNFILFKKNIDEAKREEEKQRQVLTDALENAKEASKAKGYFLSNMSHEIRTPLNAIIGYLSLTHEEDVSDDKVRHCITNCEIASKHLLQIINDILDMSAIENGKLQIAHEEFDLKQEITDVTTIFYQNAKNKGVKFETQVIGLTEEWVVGDQLRVNQILMNLLSNAVKFTPEDGTVRLSICQKGEDENRVYIQFEISDTGIGMADSYMERLFHPFEQENATTARKYGGSGLGLSITKNLISMMNGTISVKSRQNEGTTFTVTLYFSKSKNHATEPAGMDYSHVRVLVVDDKEVEGSYVKKMLKRCGVKSDTAVSGADAIRRLQARKDSDYAYDMCILDWNMPDMNGIEVAKEIRNLFGEKMPVIIATAYDVTELQAEAKAAGVNQVIAKPLFQSTLFDMLVSMFGKYDPAAEQEKENTKIDLSELHILLTEDNEMNMEIAVTVLEKAGISIDQAVNGKEAVERFTSAPSGTYDMILMDIQMPVMNGYEAAEAIRNSSHPEAKTIPIIAMTANAFAEDVAEALASGMDAHISKPVNFEKMFSVLKKFTK